MKMFRILPRALGILAATAVILLNSGCQKEKDTAPGIPPESSFVMDFSAFSNPGDTTGGREATSYHHWGYAYSNVVGWSLLLYTELAVPVATFAEAFDHQAVYHPELGNWTWNYSVVFGSTVYNAELTASLEPDSVNWEMRIDQSGAYSDFLWYYGKSAFGNTGGFWVLQQNPEIPVPVLRIDWNKYGDSTSDIKYTNIEEGSSTAGNYILYGTAIADLDRFYDIYKAPADNLAEIEWNSISKNGRVKDFGYFGDELWRCWDSALQDVECP